tara:strand:- start:375 stop:1169 length:795 start_codon:yes stop_codon:yes gene_type:complete
MGVRPILISLTIPLIVLSVDILTWPKFILTDMIYAYLVLLATFFVIKGIVKNKTYFFQLALVMLLLLATRPSSFPVNFIIIFFILISNFEFLFKSKWILIFFLALLFLTPFMFALIYSFVELNFNEIARIEFITTMVKEGVIVHDRPDTWVDQPNSFLEIANIYFLRLINFFNPYASSFSMLHFLLNLLQTFIVIISIFLWLYISNKTISINKIIAYILLLSFSVAAFHSFILIDYDWRYRFPIILPLLMLFPISLEMFLKKIK